MVQSTTIILALLYGLAMYRFSAWRTGRQLDANSTELVDPALTPLVRRMARTLELPEIRVHVYEVDQVNGLAAPDGRIFITRGFLRKYRTGEVSSDELASVIAHELGHVALGHSRRRMIVFTGQNAFRATLMIALGRFLPFPPVLRWLSGRFADFVTSLFAAKLSRNDEFEADAYAAALLVKTGIGIEPQTSLLRKLDDLSRTSARNIPAWFLSHPTARNRIEAIEALSAKWTGDRRKS
ncbi:MAG: M48 family metallopeptidase [Rhodobacter sp.]|nr:M48 family metallopeptidase [Rhodobacter sp.]MCY4169722.1 M48 family metallopeptidase [Rhodobacter sp.]